MSSLVLQRHGSVHVLCGPLDAYAQLPRFQTTKLDGTPEAAEQTKQVRDVLKAADARNLSHTEVFELLEHAHGGQLRFTLTLVPAEPVASLDALVATPDWWRSVFVLSSWTKASIAALAELAPKCAVPAPRADAYSPDFPGFPVVATLSNDGVLVENTALNLAPCQVTSAGHGHLILFAMYAVRPLPADVDNLLQVICNSDNAIINKKSESAGKKAFKALGFAPSRTLTADQFAHLEKVYAAVRALDDKFNGRHVFARKFELVLHAAAVAFHLGGPDTFVTAVQELIAANNPLLVGSKGVREVVAAMKRYVGEEGLSFADCFAEAVAKGHDTNARGTVAKGARAAAAEAAAAEAAAATRKRKERDERTEARGGDGGGAAPARQRKKSKAAEKPGAASPPGQSSSEEEVPAGEPAGTGVSTPARGAEEGAVAAAPALDEYQGMAAKLLDMLSTTRIAGYELAGPMTPEDLRIFQEGDVRDCVTTVEAPPPTAAELRALRASFDRKAYAHTFASMAKHADTPALKNAVWILSMVIRDPALVHISRVRYAHETLLGLTDEENAEADAYERANKALQAFCDKHYREAAIGWEPFLTRLDVQLGEDQAMRPLPKAWYARLEVCAISCSARDGGRTVAVAAAVRARDAEQLRGSRGGGSESEASFWPRAEGTLPHVHAEDEHVRAVIIAIWWCLALVLEQEEPRTLERLFGEAYEAAGPCAETSDDEEAEEEAGAESSEEEEEEDAESSDEED